MVSHHSFISFGFSKEINYKGTLRQRTILGEIEPQDGKNLKANPIQLDFDDGSQGIVLQPCWMLHKPRGRHHIQ